MPDADERAGIDHRQLLEAAAGAAYRAGALDRALALVDQALAEVGHGGMPEPRAMLLALRARILRDLLGHDDEGIAVLEQAVALLAPELPSCAGAHVLGELAGALLRVEQFERAGAVAKRALDAAHAVGVLDEQLDAQIALGHCMVYSGEVDAGLALVQQTADSARRAGLTWIASLAFINLSDLLLMEGRYDEAVAIVDEGMPVAEQAGAARTVGAFMRGNKAEALLRAGRWEEAMACATTGAEAAGVFAATVLLVRAELHALAGRRSDAEADLREARRQLRNTSAAQFALPLAAVEAELACSGGDLDAASRDHRAGAVRQRRRGPALSVAGDVTRRDESRLSGRSGGATSASVRPRTPCREPRRCTQKPTRCRNAPRLTGATARLSKPSTPGCKGAGRRTPGLRRSAPAGR